VARSSQIYAQTLPCSDQRRAFERSGETARIALLYSAFSSLTFRLLFPYGHSVVRRPIGQPLPDDALQRSFGAFHVIYAETHAVAIAEIKFREIAVQMFLAAMLVDADHAALEDGEEAFRGVSVDLAPHIFAEPVFNSFVARKLLSNLAIIGAFVGHDRSLAGDVGANHWRDIGNAGAFQVEAAGRTAAFDETENDVLVAGSLPLGLALDLAEEGFIGLDDRASAAHGLDADDSHGFPYSVRHEPRGLEGHAQGSTKLIRTDALLAGAQKEHRLEPQAHRDVAILEDGADLHGELLSALVALVNAVAGALAAHLRNAIEPAAVRADRTVRPHPSLYPGVARSLGLQCLGVENGLRHDQSPKSHCAARVSWGFGSVKYNIAIAKGEQTVYTPAIEYGGGRLVPNRCWRLETRS
jgi:hypothetical protein